MALPPVQAGSLAKVIDLADDPPAQFERNAAAGVQQPLVLYIARVPGSRDVFLTTMKPQQRVVTAQDIESSLYYVHVDSEKDIELLRSEDEMNGSLRAEDEEDGAGLLTVDQCTTSIHRKPVLPPRRTTMQPHTSPEIMSHSQPPSYSSRSSVLLGRKPVGQGSNKPGHKSMGADAIFPPRNILGPRPMQDRLHSANNAVLESVPQRQNIDTRRWSEQPPGTRPPLPLRPYEEKQRDLDEIYRANSTYSNERPPSMEDSEIRLNGESYDIPPGQWPASESSLTLIRRYDHLQSNVGKIKASSRPSDPLVLDIIGLGYSKFNEHANGEMNGISLEEQEQSVYRCHLGTIGDSARPKPDSRMDSPDLSLARRPGLRASFDRRRRSQVSSSGFDTSSNPKPASTKGYTFRSPWNGTCDFTTGVAGRSLKCRHSHPSNYAQATDVSELRFNLPSSKAFAPAPKSSAPNTPRESKRSLFFSNHHQRQSSFDSYNGSTNGTHGPQVELEDHLDLSLGQEHAGGGFGGKQAKLGKLIVEHEGLQMLDLVVAANMALWWRVYDRMT